jgi:cysteine desulfurase/selenocysteine lyase
MITALSTGLTAPVGLPEIPAAAPHVLDFRRDFPILRQVVQGQPLVYLDNAASTQKPRAVISALARYYEEDNANVHRGVHALGDRATAEYERARSVVQRFLGARAPQEVIFVRGATEAINLVAQTFGRQRVGPGDEVVVTGMEHHANIVPWQMLCRDRGAALRVAPITDAGDLRLDALEGLLTPRTRLVALTHVSNVLGTVNPIKQVVALAHRRGIPVLVDGAQAVAHLEVDVQDLDCDFYAFSGHKVYGPMGIGVLYGKAHDLEEMPPWQGGGDMVQQVSFEETTYSAPPSKFEAGTPNVAGAVGLAAALDYLEGCGRQAIRAHEARLLVAAEAHLRAIPGVRILGAPARRAGVISFVVEDPPMSALDVGTRLDLEGIAVRTGHHCCQPLHQRLGVAGSVRASFALYNTPGEVERFAAALRAIVAAAVSSTRRVAARGPTDRLEPIYPTAVAAGIAEAAEELAEELGSLGDWSQRYQYLLELGEALPPMPPEMKTEANRVRGCLSVSFLSTRQRPGTADVVEFLADSDGQIVRGLMAVLQRLLSGRHAGAILAVDLPAYFRRIGLEANLTAGRRNGLADMVKRLRDFAASLAPTPEPHSAPGTPKWGLFERSVPS